MASTTIGNKKLGYKKRVYGNFAEVEEVPAVCFDVSVNWWPKEEVLCVEEMSDIEIQTLPEKIGMFYFLHDEEEDIYSESDGVSIE